MSKLHELRQLYQEIHLCTRCHSDPYCKIPYSPDRAERIAFENTLHSRVFLVGPAVARATQYRSGIPYRKPSGELSRAGMFLNEHLRSVGYCLPPRDNNLQEVYSSDIVQCYPGKAASGREDRPPNKREVDDCFPWLLSEIRLIKPKILVLLGDRVQREFCARFLGRDRNTWRLGKVSQQSFLFRIEGLMVYVYAVYHPAAARWPKLNANPQYARTFDLIKLDLDND